MNRVRRSVPVGVRGGVRRAALAAVALLAVAPVLAPLASTPAQASTSDAWSQTKTLTRTFVSTTASGDERRLEVDNREVTVKVDRTTELRGRERVKISWSGAHPTGGRAASPFGENGLLQEYPVVIMQCRGVENPKAGQEQLSPETCWTSSRMQRSQMLSPSLGAWRHDLHASEADRALKSGVDEIPAECDDAESFATRITPFKAANGRTYTSCTAETMAPEAAVGAAFPAAEVAAFTDLAGNGETQFEVRSSVENESLGCSSSVDCSIVVVPIMGLSCAATSPASESAECRRGGQFEPGTSNFAQRAIDMAVSPALWWSESNWRGRFSVPITFGLDPDACDVMDTRAPTGFYGSELMSQAALQWSPAYCLRKDRFKFQHNRMGDGQAFTLMENGGGAAAFVSGAHEQTGADPVGYAPTAITGFGIGYVVDRPDNAGEVKNLRLNARLLAKLITQSYPASDRGRGHPGMEDNPLSINRDPEFQKLNPGLDTIARESAAALIQLSEASDVITALTSYIAQDADAMAFVNGKADPWGMKVNPSYAKITLPVAEWPLLDDYVPPSNLECHVQNPSPYLGQVAAPVTHLRKIAEAVLDGWPNVQTKCDRATMTDPWKIGRVDRQGVGSRFVLGVVSLGDAARFGLNNAQLHTRGSSYVGPTATAMTRAVGVAERAEDGVGAFTLDMAKVVKARTAYPGTLVVHTAARTAGASKAEAKKVAQFIRVATAEGQQVGRGNGQLPAGYVPIRRTGATKALHTQAQEVATKVAAQKAPSAPREATPDTDPSPSTEPPASTPVDLPSDVPASDAAPAQEPAAVPTPDAATPVAAMPPTASLTSGVAGGLLPGLLAAVLLAAALAVGARLSLWARSR